MPARSESVGLFSPLFRSERPLTAEEGMWREYSTRPSGVTRGSCLLQIRQETDYNFLFFCLQGLNFAKEGKNTNRLRSKLCSKAHGWHNYLDSLIWTAVSTPLPFSKWFSRSSIDLMSGAALFGPMKAASKATASWLAWRENEEIVTQ